MKSAPCKPKPAWQSVTSNFQPGKGEKTISNPWETQSMQWARSSGVMPAESADFRPRMISGSSRGSGRFGSVTGTSDSSNSVVFQTGPQIGPGDAVDGPDRAVGEADLAADHPLAAGGAAGGDVVGDAAGGGGVEPLYAA